MQTETVEQAESQPEDDGSGAALRDLVARAYPDVAPELKNKYSLCLLVSSNVNRTFMLEIRQTNQEVAAAPRLSARRP